MSTTATLSPVPTRRHGVGHRLGALLMAASALTGIGMAAGVVTAPAASASVTISNVTSYGFPTYNTCTHRVTVKPMTNERAYSYSAYFRLAVYNSATRGWTYTGWSLENGINEATVYSLSPGYSAYVQYAKVVNGTWRYAGEYVAIDYSSAGNLWCS